MLSDLFEDGEDEGSNASISIVSDVFIPGPKPRKPAEPRAACNLPGTVHLTSLNSFLLYNTPSTTPIQV